MTHPLASKAFPNQFEIKTKIQTPSFNDRRKQEREKEHRRRLLCQQIHAEIQNVDRSIMRYRGQIENIRERMQALSLEAARYSEHALEDMGIPIARSLYGAASAIARSSWATARTAGIQAIRVLYQARQLDSYLQIKEQEMRRYLTDIDNAIIQIQTLERFKSQRLSEQRSLRC